MKYREKKRTAFLGQTAQAVIEPSTLGASPTFVVGCLVCVVIYLVFYVYGDVFAIRAENGQASGNPQGDSSLRGTSKTLEGAGGLHALSRLSPFGQGDCGGTGGVAARSHSSCESPVDGLPAMAEEGMSLSVMTSHLSAGQLEMVKDIGSAALNCVAARYIIPDSLLSADCNVGALKVTDEHVSRVLTNLGGQNSPAIDAARFTWLKARYERLGYEMEWSASPDVGVMGRGVAANASGDAASIRDAHLSAQNELLDFLRSKQSRLPEQDALLKKLQAVPPTKVSGLGTVVE